MNRKKNLTAVILSVILVLVIALTGCNEKSASVAGETASDKVVSGNVEENLSDTVTVETTNNSNNSGEVSPDSSKKDTNSVSDNTAGAVNFTFSDSAITADKEGGYSIEGTTLTIEKSGEYVLSGSSSDGRVTVKKGVDGVVIVLNGLDLTSQTSAPITVEKSSEVTILAAEASVNNLSDTAKNNDDNYSDNVNAENAVIKAKDGSNLTIGGTGIVNINANGKNGIKSGSSTKEEGEASLTIEDLTLNVTANVNDAINAESTLTILSGNVTVTALEDGIHSDYALIVGKEGTDGPKVVVTQAEEGLEAATIDIYSGNVSTYTTDDGINAANSDLEGYAFKLNIHGGYVYVDTPTGDGLDSNGIIDISGGTVEVFSQSSGDNAALDADGQISINGATVLTAGAQGMGTSYNTNQGIVFFAAGISKGKTISVVDESGKKIAEKTAVRDASFVVFSSAEIKSGQTYTLNVDGASAVTAKAQSGAVNSGGGFGGPGRR